MKEKFKQGFTLMELILVVVVMTTVLAAINAFLFSALHLRQRVTDSVDRAISGQRVLTLLRRDLVCAVSPSGQIAGNFKVGNVSDSILDMNVIIELCTATGAPRNDEPWGDVQRISYGLQEPVGTGESRGRTLVRSVTRNLLGTASPDVENQWLMDGVESVKCECFDGVQWYDAWDTASGNTNLPSAVRVNVQLAGESPGMESSVELVVPLVSQSVSVPSATVPGGGTE